VLIAACVVSATVQVPPELLNEWSQFKADDEFFNQMDAFLETSSQSGQAGGDFEFKCETTCQLVQKNQQVEAPASHAAHSLLETDEGSKENIEEAFYRNVDSFLETESTQAGGDFEFKCETTCQLVQKNSAETAEPAASGSSGSGSGSPTHHNAVHNLLQTEAGVGTEMGTETSAKAQQAKDCYRLCLNPSMNPGCDTAANAVSLLETGVATEAELMRKNWSLGSGSGNCLNSCVHVCMAVHDSKA